MEPIQIPNAHLLGAAGALVLVGISAAYLYCTKKPKGTKTKHLLSLVLYMGMHVIHARIVKAYDKNYMLCKFMTCTYGHAFYIGSSKKIYYKMDSMHDNISALDSRYDRENVCIHPCYPYMIEKMSAYTHVIHIYNPCYPYIYIYIYIYI
jgi:hypothetical protein